MNCLIRFEMLVKMRWMQMVFIRVHNFTGKHFK